MSRIIYTTEYGSHLYGTTTPTSDVDLISIMVPKYNDLLLQNVSQFSSKHTILNKQDVTVHALPKIVKDICDGNSTALEILFSSEGSQVTLKSPIWNKIYNNRLKLLTKKSDSLIGYCRSQSKKYDVRGDKMRAVSDLKAMYLRLNSGFGLSTMTVEEYYDKNHDEFRVLGNGYTTVVSITQKSGGAVDHLSICGRKIPFTIPHYAIIECLNHLESEYGSRTKEAAQGDGVDWKGMMHSVRIAEQAVEFFSNATMTFPRPNADYLLAIRNKEINYNEVSQKIDKLLLDVEATSLISNMQQKPIQEEVDNLLLEIYEEMRYV